MLFILSTAAKMPDLHWLEGEWEGNGGEQSISFSWTIRISYKADANIIKLEYPSHSCGGTLKIISIEKGNATCTEDLTYGLSQCSTGLKVTLKKELDGSITLAYYYADTKTLKSTAKLKRK